MSRRTARVLRRAADLVEQRGWCQDQGEDSQGRICAMRAINLATKQEGGLAEEALIQCVGLPATIAVEDHLGTFFLHEWNDERDRTRADVVKAFHQVADLEDFRP